MKNVFKKVAIASALVAASSASFADEIGNVQVDVNYVSTCTVTNSPVATFTDLIPGDFAFTNVTIDFDCSTTSNESDVQVWLNRQALYAEDAEHVVAFLPSDFVSTGDISRSSVIDLDTGLPNNNNAERLTLTPGTNSYSVTYQVALVKDTGGTEFEIPSVYDDASIQVPVNVAFN